MDKKKKQYILVGIIIFAIILIDQIVKYHVKTSMQIGEEIPLIGDWCKLHFVENMGFAFGATIGGVAGKIALTLFRFVASGAMIWFLLRKIKSGLTTPLAICGSLIIAGALGNLIDSCFYGLIFNESYYHVAELFPAEGGYGKFLQGRVVDMFYFPLIDTTWPDWIPFVGGNHFTFFNAIFNVADAAITVGAAWLVVDQLFFSTKRQKDANAATED